MKTLKSSVNVAVITTAVAVIALIASLSVSAAGSRVLDDAINDFDNTSAISTTESTYDYSEDQSFILSADTYDYAPRSYVGLEEAEFAAFEVPDTLVVSD